jgi:hypothetical protein
MTSPPPDFTTQREGKSTGTREEEAMQQPTNSLVALYWERAAVVVDRVP